MYNSQTVKKKHDLHTNQIEYLSNILLNSLLSEEQRFIKSISNDIKGILNSYSPHSTDPLSQGTKSKSPFKHSSNPAFAGKPGSLESR